MRNSCCFQLCYNTISNLFLSIYIHGKILRRLRCYLCGCKYEFMLKILLLMMFLLAEWCGILKKKNDILSWAIIMRKALKIPCSMFTYNYAISLYATKKFHTSSCTWTELANCNNFTYSTFQWTARDPPRTPNSTTVPVSSQSLPGKFIDILLLLLLLLKLLPYTIIIHDIAYLMCLQK